MHDAIALLSIAASAGLSGYFYSSLPEQIPSHFSFMLFMVFLFAVTLLSARSGRLNTYLRAVQREGDPPGSDL
jgi:hypothetical protein